MIGRSDPQHGECEERDIRDLVVGHRAHQERQIYASLYERFPLVRGAVNRDLHIS